MSHSNFAAGIYAAVAALVPLGLSLNKRADREQIKRIRSLRRLKQSKQNCDFHPTIVA